MGLFGGDSTTRVDPLSQGLDYSGNVGGQLTSQNITFTGQVKNTTVNVPDTQALAIVSSLTDQIAGENSILGDALRFALIVGLAWGAWQAYRFVRG